MEVISYERSPDWPKLGPSMMIATAMVVAIRTAKWAAQTLVSDVDPDLDKEVDFAMRITSRVMDSLLQKNPGLFPRKENAHSRTRRRLPGLELSSVAWLSSPTTAHFTPSARIPMRLSGTQQRLVVVRGAL